MFTLDIFVLTYFFGQPYLVVSILLTSELRQQTSLHSASAATLTKAITGEFLLFNLKLHISSTDKTSRRFLT